MSKPGLPAIEIDERAPRPPKLEYPIRSVSIGVGKTADGVDAIQCLGSYLRSPGSVVDLGPDERMSLVAEVLANYCLSIGLPATANFAMAVSETLAGRVRERADEKSPILMATMPVGSLRSD